MDAIAKESASEVCIRCAGARRWTTAARMYETPEWDFFYCFECSHWYRRHFRLRYIVSRIEDRNLVESLESQVDFGYDMMMEPLRSLHGFKARLAGVWRRLFQRAPPERSRW